MLPHKWFIAELSPINGLPASSVSVRKITTLTQHLKGLHMSLGRFPYLYHKSLDDAMERRSLVMQWLACCFPNTLLTSAQGTEVLRTTGSFQPKIFVRASLQQVYDHCLPSFANSSKTTRPTAFPLMVISKKQRGFTTRMMINLLTPTGRLQCNSNAAIHS